MMLQPVILNTEKLNSQVMIRTYRLSEDEWSFTLNNMTRNTYKVFLESYMSKSNELIFKADSSEFLLLPGIMTVTENEIGHIMTKAENKNLITGLVNKTLSPSDKYRLSVCVKQKYGPDLGFQYIQI